MAGEHTPIAKINFNGPCFAGKKYNPIGLVQFSRGCRYRCDFCSIHEFYHNKVKQKNADDVVSEIRSMKEKLVFFIDDNLFFDEKSALDLCSRIRPLKKMGVPDQSGCAKNDSLLSAMKTAAAFWC